MVRRSHWRVGPVGGRAGGSGAAPSSWPTRRPGHLGPPCTPDGGRNAHVHIRSKKNGTRIYTRKDLIL